MHDSVKTQLDYVRKFYPNINIAQLGMMVLLLGTIRSTMGHESVRGTIENYIHPNGLSPDIREHLDFIEREILGIKRSKIDIDYWKMGNEGGFRRNEDKLEACV